jgi:hypothetical protein
MKRRSRKLSLARETLVMLDARQLEALPPGGRRFNFNGDNFGSDDCPWSSPTVCPSGCYSDCWSACAPCPV